MKIAAIAIISALTFTVASQAQNIQQRKYNQQARIANGVRSGELTHREAGRLEHQEHAVNREERNMRAVNSGRLTRGDRAVLNHQQNVESRRVFNQKHDAQVR